MKKYAVIFLIFVLPLSSIADNRVNRETVEKLLKVVNAESRMNIMYSQMDTILKGMAKQLGVKKSERAVFDKFMTKVVIAMKQEMTWDKTKGPMIDIYIKHYTEKEIKDLIVFYESESGRALIKKQPLVMKDSMHISQSMFREFMPKMKKLSEELQKNIAAARMKK